MSGGIVFSRRILKNDQQTYVPDPEVASRLLEWYGREGRDLPWRRTRDPYRIWISEVILQQTRVAQGMSYYHRFLELFPDVVALASAPEDLVLKCWQGLGYYSRARNLLAAARRIVEMHGGVFPTDYAVQVLPVVVNRKGAAGERIGKVLSAKFMHGVNIRSIVRAGVKIPVRSGAKLDAGDRIELVGLPQDVRRAAAQLGFSDPVKTESSVPLLGLGICLGGLIFGWMLVAKIGAIPLSLTVSGGVLLAGLFCGWARSRRPTLGGIPEQTVWFMNNMGLNTFIAIVGISTGPSFVAGFQQVGWSLFLVGAGATTLPLVLGVLIGRYLFRFNDALTLGCVAGARTTTAALGAVEDTIGSNVPSLGYTITYAIGNTLLIIWGVVLVLLLA